MGDLETVGPKQRSVYEGVPKPSLVEYCPDIGRNTPDLGRKWLGKRLFIYERWKMKSNSAEYHRNYYHTKRDKKALIAQKSERRRFLKQKVFEYLLEHPCVDCGESDPIVLEFDHVRGNKEVEIASALQRGWALSRIEAEITKCDVRCANCHRRKTAKDFNYYQGIV